MSQAKTVLESSEHVACQMKIQEKVETTWLFDTGADAHVMPKWEQLGEPTLQSTCVTLKGANGQDLGAIGEVLVNGFIGKVKVHFKAVVARDVRRCLLSGTQLRAKGSTFRLNEKGSFLAQPKSEGKIKKSREGNRDTFKIVCMLKPRDVQSVTSLMLKRELEHVRRELRNLKTGQHENKQETVGEEMTAHERITHERTGHAANDPRCRRVSECEE